MSNDLISREDLRKALKSNCTPELCHDYGTNWCEVCCPHNDFEDLIDNAPTVEYPEQITIKCVMEEDKQKLLSALRNVRVTRVVEEERPQGEWIDIDSRVSKAMCSKCKNIMLTEPYGKTDFCPNCGADMRGDGQ